MAGLTEAQLGQLEGLPLPAVRPGPEAWTLEDADAFWVVTEGRVEVFARAVRPGLPPGVRRHLLSLEPGQVLGGLRFPGGFPHWEAVAVCAGGGRLLAGRFSQLQGPAVADLRQLLLGQFLEAVMTALAGRVMAERQPPVQAFLGPGRPVTLKAGGRTAVREGLGWVEVRAGEAFLLGEGSWRLEAGRGPFPLVRGLWLLAGAAGATLRRLDAGELPEWGAGAQASESVFGSLMEWEGSRLDREEREDLERLRAKAEAESALRRRSLAALAALGAPRNLDQPPLAGDGDLLAACRRVGQAADIRFQPAPGWALLTGALDPLAAICRASRVRCRKVALRGPWWKRDAGPLLGYLGEARAPVALLPRARGGYLLQQPAGGPPRPLDPALAGQLDPFAFSFYRPCPVRPMALGDLAGTAWRETRGDLGWVLAMALAGAGLGLALPLALALMTAEVIPQADPAQVWVLFATLALLAAGAALFDLARGLAFLRVEARSASSLQAAMVDRLLGLPAKFFTEFTVGDLIQRVTAVETIQAVLTGATVSGLLTAVGSGLNLGLMVYLAPGLGGLAAVLAVAVVLGSVWLARLNLRLESGRQAAAARLSGMTFQMLNGVAKLRVAAAEGRAFAMWCGLLRAERKLAMAQSRADIGFLVLTRVLPADSLVVLFTGLRAPRALDPAHFLAFIAAFASFFTGLAAAGLNLRGAVQLAPLLERARPILAAVSEEDAARPDPGLLTGLVEASHLSFRYAAQGPQVLQDVTFHAAPGEFVAFVGASGSGKSTTLRLLLAFEAPETGVIHYDRQDLAALDVVALRSQLGVVLQHSRLLAGTVLQNIVGVSPLTLEEAWEAAEAAGLADDIRALPMGMHTVVSEGGSTFSGGQRQRLIIARALARKPRIILFDEATSALDSRTQAVVSRSLERLNATRIIIAHRLSTIRNADRIYVMEQGRITQVGSYPELLGAPGLFRQLAARQVA